MKGLDNADWEAVRDTISFYLNWARESPDELLSECSRGDRSLDEVLASSLTHDIVYELEELLQDRLPSVAQRTIHFEEVYESMGDSRLQQAIRDLKFQLETAEAVSAERRKQIARFETMKLHDLAKHVFAKGRGWKLAQVIYSARLKAVKPKPRPEQAPAKQSGVPHDPEGTPGDYWREHSG